MASFFVFPALDILERLLTFDPSQRLTAHEALQHSYLAEYRGTSMPSAGTPLRLEHEVSLNIRYNMGFS